MLTLETELSDSSDCSVSDEVGLSLDTLDSLLLEELAFAGGSEGGAFGFSGAADGVSSS